MTLPVDVLRALEPGVELKPLPGLTLQLLPNTGFLRIEVHYKVIAGRRDPAWAAASARRYGTLGVHSARWRREMEIDWEASPGEPVFANFARSVHTVAPFDVPAHWPRWLLYDVGGVNPHALLWATVDPTPPDYDIYIYREYYKGIEMPDKTKGPYLTASDVLKVAYELSLEPSGREERLQAVIIDSAARMTSARKQGGDAKLNKRAATIFEELLEDITALGWDVNLEPGNNLKDRAIEDMIDRLGNFPLFATDDAGEILVTDGQAVPLRDPDGQPLIVKPRLFVFTSCKWTIWELSRYRWSEWVSSKVAETRNAPEEPVDKDDHQITNLVRLMNWLRRDTDYTEIEPSEPPQVPADQGSAVVQAWAKRLRAERARVQPV